MNVDGQIHVQEKSWQQIAESTEPRWEDYGVSDDLSDWNIAAQFDVWIAFIVLDLIQFGAWDTTMEIGEIVVEEEPQHKDDDSGGLEVIEMSWRGCLKQGERF